MFYKLFFEFPYRYVYSPTCQTVVSDPFLWYSGLDPVIVEEKPEEAAGEPHQLVEWQVDNVIQTLGRALRHDTFWGIIDCYIVGILLVVPAFVGHYFWECYLNHFLYKC